MVHNLETNHGADSKKVLLEFLSRKELSVQPYLDALVIVENHDNKKYTYQQRIGSYRSSRLLRILSVADDLDAFGRLGVLRYSEINLLRGIHMSDLAKRVLPNIDKRYDHLDTQYGSLSGFVGIQKERYQLTRSFFSDLKRKKTAGQNGKPSAYEEVINHLIKIVLIEKRDYSYLIKHTLKNTENLYLKHFFEGVQHELKSRSISL